MPAAKQQKKAKCSPLPRKLSGGLIQYTVRKVPTQYDVAQTSYIANTVCRPEECAATLQKRIGGTVVRGHVFHKGELVGAHAWVEKDGLIYDSAFKVFAEKIKYGSQSHFLIAPKDSCFSREHFSKE